jgi:hypothetical protein
LKQRLPTGKDYGRFEGFAEMGLGGGNNRQACIQPSEELKVGDGIRVMIEKVVTLPDPEEEKTEEPACETAENVEAVAENAEEALEKAESAVETPAETETDTKTECDLK